MIKKDFVYVFVKLSGFTCILVAIVSNVGSIVTLALAAVSNSVLASAVRGMAGVSLLTPLIQIVIGLVVIKKTARITDWLMSDDRT